MNNTIKNSLKKSITYNDYRVLVKHLAEYNDTTGNNKTEASINYTKLNDRRMKRWDKTIKLSQDIEAKMKTLNEPVTWLVLTESWCGDAAHILPVLNKLAEANNKIDFRLVFRDENPELMDMFLTDGTRSIPKVIMIDNESDSVVGTYGPRPSVAANYVTRFKAMHGKLTPEFKEDLQHWYNNDKGQTIIEDVTQMLCQLEPNLCQ